MTPTTEFADERETVLHAQRGDRAAFSQLVDAYDRRLLYFVRRVMGEHDAEFDVLQTVWLTVHRKLRGLKSASAFRVWLYRITHDTAVTELCKKTRRALFVEELAINVNQADEGDAQSKFDNAELVHVGLQRLSVDHRRILTLRFLEDMNVKEIAEVLRCNEGTVKSRLHHARRALRRVIEEVQDV
jgi:RNA polymerase sigma-70 factor (ECF subfamily)